MTPRQHFYGNNGVPRAYIGLMAAVFSILLGGNGFFIKRLVDKIDNIDSAVWELKTEVASLRATVDDLKIASERGASLEDLHGSDLRKRSEAVFGRKSRMAFFGLRLPLQVSRLQDNPHRSRSHCWPRFPVRYIGQAKYQLRVSLRKAQC